MVLLLMTTTTTTTIIILTIINIVITVVIILIQGATRNLPQAWSLLRAGSCNGNAYALQSTGNRGSERVLAGHAQ